MKERRQFYRWEFSIPCRYWWEETVAKGKVTNISFGGLCISEASKIPPQGTILNVRLSLGENYQCNLQAEVVYTRPSPINQAVFGVEFEDAAAHRSHKLAPVLGACMDQAFSKA